MQESGPRPFSTNEKRDMRDCLQEEGFFIRRILDDDEIETLRDRYAKVLAVARPNRTGAKVDNSFQHLGDRLEDFGTEARQYYIHVLTSPGTEPLHAVYRHPAILKTVEFLLGGELIINNASILAANPGTYYNLGWQPLIRWSCSRWCRRFGARALCRDSTTAFFNSSASGRWWF